MHLSGCVSIITNHRQTDWITEDVTLNPPPAEKLAKGEKKNAIFKNIRAAKLKSRASNENTIPNPGAVLFSSLSALQQPECCVLMCEHEHDLQEMGSLLWQDRLCSRIDLAEVRSRKSGSFSNRGNCISLYITPSAGYKSKAASCIM